MSLLKSNAGRALFQIVVPMVAITAIDQLSKGWVLAAGTRFVVNGGFIGGMLSGSPALIRIIFVLILFLVLAALFCAFQFLFFRVEAAISTLASCLFAGYGSNLIDKIHYNGVIDFIWLPISPSKAIVMNIADMIQQIAFVALIVVLIKKHEHIWPTINLRRVWMVDHAFQLAGALFGTVFFLLGGVSGSLVVLLFYRVYQGRPDVALLFLCLGLLFAILMVVTMVAGIIFFNRAAGPVFAANRFLEKMLGDEYGEVKFRKNDFFPGLNENLNKLASKLKKNR